MVARCRLNEEFVHRAKSIGKFNFEILLPAEMRITIFCIAPSWVRKTVEMRKVRSKEIQVY